MMVLPLKKNDVESEHNPDATDSGLLVRQAQIESLHERCAGLLSVLAILFNILGEVAMLVPGFVE